jgi:predicted dienelactone hydrolase
VKVGVLLCLIWVLCSIQVTSASFAEDLIAVKGVAQPVVQAQFKVGGLNSFLLHDRKRKKDVEVRVTYPLSKDGSFPVVIFSHGAGGSKDVYLYLTRYWASRGYVCIQPSHADSLNTENSAVDKAEKMKVVLKGISRDFSGWENRSKDISFIIDSLPLLQRRLPAQMNVKRIALAGHSYGAFTATLIAGATVPAPESARLGPCADARVGAIIALSPQGVRRNDLGFGFRNQHDWAGVKIPAMFITGTQDLIGLSRPADRRAPFDYSSPGNKYFVMIEGANHMTFAGIEQGGIEGFAGGELPGHQLGNRAFGDRLRQRLRARIQKQMGVADEQGDRKKMLNCLQAATTAFLDAYLKDDKKSQAELKAGSFCDSRVAKFESR